MTQTITEEQGVHKNWYAEAKNQTLETLPEFLRKLTQDYNHDYGTIVHAVSAAAIAAAIAVDKSEVGGITGFQGGCVMWSFISHWMHYEDQPLRLVQYQNMLYPQYKHTFQQRITPETWKWLQKEASKLLEEARDGTSSTVVNHWKKIVAGEVPFGYVVAKE